MGEKRQIYAKELQLIYIDALLKKEVEYKFLFLKELLSKSIV